MGMSDRIEAFILELLSQENDWVELRRNELANIFECVPSQINYVLSTRFTPSNGYITESRRGGGGYLRIKKTITSPDLTEYIDAVGDSIDYMRALSVLTSSTNSGFLSSRDAHLITAAISDRSIPINQPYKNKIRASILKNMLIKINERTEI